MRVLGEARLVAVRGLVEEPQAVAVGRRADEVLALAAEGRGGLRRQQDIVACVEIKILRRVRANRCVVLHAIDAAPARWRGDPHPTHWLISTQGVTMDDGLIIMSSNQACMTAMSFTQ